VIGCRTTETTIGAAAMAVGLMADTRTEAEEALHASNLMTHFIKE
jgi:hypothetical protein